MKFLVKPFQSGLLCLLCCFFFNRVSAGSTDTVKVYSPSRNIAVETWINGHLQFRILLNGQVILNPSDIDFVPEKQPALSVNPRIKSSTITEVRELIEVPVPEKRKTIRDHYNLLRIRFRLPYELQFRVYDDGVAYRILTGFKDSLVVKQELARFNFPGDPSGYFPEIPKAGNEDPFKTSFEDLYTFKRIADFPSSSICYSPLLILPEATHRIALTESDLEDYPGMFFTGTGKSSLEGVFAGYPIRDSTINALYSQVRVAEHGNFIARTIGTRSFPWRVMMIAAEDRDLPGNDLVYRLGAPSRVPETAWIQPGNITDEWIIDVNLFHVPFKSGRNTASYKYYIDFAQRFGFDRIMMDAGWSDNNDLFNINPDINMDTLLAYAKRKGVKIALWTLAMTLDRQLEAALEQFSRWGVDFIMTDFIDRDDQVSVNFHHRIARACAAKKIMIMFHGTYPPKGFNRTWPNAITREAVLGSEYNVWSEKVSPDHDVLLPYTRMLAGSMDYEPGALNNANKKSFRMIEGIVYSQGTRAHQAAMPIVYDSPIQFFAGNPSQGWQEPEYMELIGSLPTMWDETKILEGKAGQYIVTARQHGSDWYIGAMTGWKERTLAVSLDFLAPGQYKAFICRDGVNADHYAADYILEEKLVQPGDKLSVPLAPGGGFLIKLIHQ